MVVACCAVGCSNRQSQKLNLSFYRIPKDAERRERWITAIHRKNWKPTTYSRLCSEHFIAENIEVLAEIEEETVYQTPVRSEPATDDDQVDVEWERRGPLEQEVIAADSEEVMSNTSGIEMLDSTSDEEGSVDQDRSPFPGRISVHTFRESVLEAVITNLMCSKMGRKKITLELAAAKLLADVEAFMQNVQELMLDLYFSEGSMRMAGGVFMRVQGILRRSFGNAVPIVTAGTFYCMLERIAMICAKGYKDGERQAVMNALEDSASFLCKVAVTNQDFVVSRVNI
ncbi:UNVERIFIED_CONTAM: hypothetical protein FKN15_066255 [Acipenser sinensis]